MNRSSVQDENSGKNDVRGSLRASEGDKSEFNHETWISLLGLMDLYECFVTIDQTNLWQSHVAWSNKGKDLREYHTNRFSSNMVFLSLLLVSTMDAITNSANFAHAIRMALDERNYGSLKYWIGCVLIIGSCAAVLGLVATYTAWGMISAISDSNAHAILRSSMGQYVTSLSSRFVVASLYLFIAWILMLVVDLITGPVRYVMALAVAAVFFQIIVSLSAFGRLIIHTGAMGKKRVLDPQLEHLLLPSGLHASLLIKATERRRRPTTSMRALYASTGCNGGEKGRTSMMSHNPLRGSMTSAAPRSSFVLPMSNAKSTLTTKTRRGGTRNARGVGSPSVNSSRRGAVTRTINLPSSTPVMDLQTVASDTDSDELEVIVPSKPLAPQRMVTGESTMATVEVDEFVTQIQFPSAAVLNEAGEHHNTLQQVLTSLSGDEQDGDDEEGMSRRPRTNNSANKVVARKKRSSLASITSGNRSSLRTSGNRSSLSKKSVLPMVEEKKQADNGDVARTKEAAASGGVARTNTKNPAALPEDEEDLDAAAAAAAATTEIRDLARQHSIKIMRRANLGKLQHEWVAEEDVREMYDMAPPVECWKDDDVEGEQDCPGEGYDNDADDNHGFRRRTSSILRMSAHRSSILDTLKSLRIITGGGLIDDEDIDDDLNWEMMPPGETETDGEVQGATTMSIRTIEEDEDIESACRTETERTTTSGGDERASYATPMAIPPPVENPPTDITPLLSAPILGVPTRNRSDLIEEP